MSEEIRLEGLGVAPSVLDTIVTVAAEGAEGIACVGSPGLAGLVQKGRKGSSRAVDVVVGEDGGLIVSVHVHVTYGQRIHEVARVVQSAVAEALTSQVGVPVTSVDVYVDGLVFAE